MANGGQNLFINEGKIVIYKFHRDVMHFLKIAYCEVGYISGVCKKNIYILGAGAIITIDANKKRYILLQKRIKFLASYSGYYHIFGGSIKVQGGDLAINNNFDNNLLETMIREISEETDFTKDNIKKNIRNDGEPLFSYFEEDKMRFAGMIYHLHFSFDEDIDKIVDTKKIFGNECNRPNGKIGFGRVYQKL